MDHSLFIFRGSAWEVQPGEAKKVEQNRIAVSREFMIHAAQQLEEATTFSYHPCRPQDQGVAAPCVGALGGPVSFAAPGG